MDPICCIQQALFVLFFGLTRAFTVAFSLFGTFTAVDYTASTDVTFQHQLYEHLLLQEPLKLLPYE